MDHRDFSASLQSRKLIDDREWDDDGHWSKLDWSVVYRRVLVHLQTAAITTGMRRYFRARPSALRLFRSANMHHELMLIIELIHPDSDSVRLVTTAFWSECYSQKCHLRMD